MSKDTLSQFVLFLCTSGIAAAIHWLARIFLSNITSYELALVMSYFIGMGVAFVLNYFFVFVKSTLTIASQIRRFIFVNIVTMPCVWGIAIFLNWQLVFIQDPFTREAVAHGFAISIPAITSFVAYENINPIINRSLIPKEKGFLLNKFL